MRSNRTPRYRSFRKAYGGDPDSSILRDLHKRVTELERSADDNRFQDDLRAQVMKVMLSHFPSAMVQAIAGEALSACSCEDLDQHMQRCWY